LQIIVCPFCFTFDHYIVLLWFMAFNYPFAIFKLFSLSFQVYQHHWIDSSYSTLFHCNIPTNWIHLLVQTLMNSDQIKVRTSTEVVFLSWLFMDFGFQAVSVMWCCSTVYFFHFLIGSHDKTSSCCGSHHRFQINKKYIW
jgi:hypothetical protein